MKKIQTKNNSITEVDLRGTEICQDEWIDICTRAINRDVEAEVFLIAQSRLSRQRRWDLIYHLSELAGLETSVLIDSNDRVFIDWGTSGQVILTPPVGAKIPFKLWVHTHPGFHPYWSGTDTNSLAIGVSIIERAMVLGATGVKSSYNYFLKKRDCDQFKLSSPYQSNEYEACSDIKLVINVEIQYSPDGKGRPTNLWSRKQLKRTIHEIREKNRMSGRNTQLGRSLSDLSFSLINELEARELNFEQPTSRDRIEMSGPLQNWSEQTPLDWAAWSCNRNEKNSEVVV